MKATPHRPPRRGCGPGVTERGVMVIWLALFMLILIAFASLSADLAKLMTTRTQLQNAADAAALAGVSALNRETGIVDPDSAIARAEFTASQHKAFVMNPEAITLLPADISFPTATQVKVTVRRRDDAGGSVVTHFARVIGITSLEMAATATAEADTTPQPCEGLVPMGPVLPPDAGWFDPSCDSTYTLKVGAGDGQQGNYELLDYPSCDQGPCAGTEGGSAIRCLSENGYGCCLDEGQEFSLTEPGNKVGPFRQGMQARWDADTDRRENICYEDYAGNGNRILPMPVVESFDVNGKKYVRILSFSAFFIKYRPPSDATLQGQFINAVISGSGSGGGHGTLYTLRLIR